jgi:hypothetical protein
MAQCASVYVFFITKNYLQIVKKITKSNSRVMAITHRTITA